MMGGDARAVNSSRVAVPIIAADRCCEVSVARHIMPARAAGLFEYYRMLAAGRHAMNRRDPHYLRAFGEASV